MLAIDYGNGGDVDEDSGGNVKKKSEKRTGYIDRQRKKRAISLNKRINNHDRRHNIPNI